jgi:hypothetical protein
MQYVIIRREISKYLISGISCDHLFRKIENLKEEEVILDFLLVYYVSNEFIDAYIANKAVSTKKIIERNMPLTMKNITG